MTQKLAQFLNKGMVRDISISKINNEFAFENFNIRLTASDENTLLSVTNERGNKVIPNITIYGTILGYCVINTSLVIFSTMVGSESPDYIYRVCYDNDSWTSEILYQGNLKFDVNHPIETLGIYEAESIQKVYWLDGINQPRVINISARDSSYNDTSFDFLPTLKLEEEVTINKEFNYPGLFPSGVIQYVLTYSKDYGQESAIFYTSKLLYLTDEFRGLSAEDTASCSFRITIDNVDTSFDKINIYSIIRTSENGTPTTKLVSRRPINGSTSITFLDLNTTGEIIDPTELFYKGGEWVSAYTMAHKDNTLFLGNVKLLRNPVSDDLKRLVKTYSSISEGLTVSRLSTVDGYFEYRFTLNGSTISYMKKGEWYRLGVQFQDSHGKWSDPVFIKDRMMKSYPSFVGNNPNIPFVKIALSEDTIKKAASEGYIKVRPVVVYPDYSERVCVAQGILNPTVFSFKGRLNNAPFAQASWFFRPLGGYPDNIEWRDLHTLASPNKIGCEIMNQDNLKYFRPSVGPEFWEYPVLGTDEDIYAKDIKAGDGSTIHYSGVENNNNFCVDCSVVTLNSPDIESLSGSYNNLKLRIVGAVNIDVDTPSWGTYKVNTSSGPAGGLGYGFFNPDYSRIPPRGQLSSWGAYIDVPLWLKNSIYFPDKLFEGKGFAHAVYPWHRSGSLNSDYPREGRTGVLQSKILSNITYIKNSEHYYFNTPWYADSYKDISQVNIIEGSEKTLSVLPKPINSDDFIDGITDIKYFGAEDTLIYPSWKSVPYYYWGYLEGEHVIPDSVNGLTNNYYGYSEFFDTLYIEGGPPASITGTYDNPTTDGYSSSEPVRMKYKSSKHAVFSFNWADGGRRITLPITQSMVNTGYGPTSTGRLIWTNSNRAYVGFSQSTFTPSELSSINSPRLLWVGELYKEVDRNTLFGGSTDSDIQNNVWYPCGKAVRLDSTNEVSTNEGDTFYQRWDCLKTYAYSDNDENSVVEILSCYIESYQNLDGRYDRNRGQLDNTAMSPKNFGLFNMAYNQRNNFFSYSVLPDLYYSNSNFPNQITWTGTKSYGEEIDTWTSIPLTSVLDMDGDKGTIQAIRRWNNHLVSFQDRGIAEILFNSRTAISTTDGIPVELGSSGKVEGKNYISDKDGCINKWSIIEGKKGIYFIDNYNASINILSDGIQSLSGAKGFDVWTKEHNSIKVWNPKTFENFRTYYDSINGDVYFVGKDTCLCYSEKLNSFVSFYSYESTPLMVNLMDKFISSNNEKLWLQNEGEYNVIFGDHVPYFVKYRITPSPYSDKIFSTIEYRADIFNSNDELTNNTFDTLEVDNEYQHGISKLNFDKFSVSNLKRKFRIWRANIPRDTKDDKRGLNRIRNPWINLKLLKDTEGDKDRIEFHDLIVRYFE